MKKTVVLISIIFFALAGIVKSQDLDLKWSERMAYDNKNEGFFSTFIDANSKYVYGKHINLTSRPKKMEKKIKLVAYDKVTMKKVADVPLVGFKENKSSKEKYKGLKYHKTVVFENLIYVFWLKDAKGKEELYVQSFNANLKPINKLKKVYECTTSDSRRSRNTQSTVVLANKKCGEKIIIGSELPVMSSGDVKFEYKVLNNDFTFSAANQIILPVKLASKAYGLTSSYEYGDDGNLYVKSFVTMSKEERKNAKKGEATAYSILTHVDLNSGATTPYEIKYENKNIFDFGYLIEKTGVKVYGFFCDLGKDPSGRAMHGVFYSKLDNTFSSKDVNFSFFDKATLEKLFANDKEDMKKTGGIFKSKKKKESDGESLDSRYEIEAVQSVDNNNIVLFCSKMYNYSVTNCTTSSNGGTTCTTSYYCEKSNVTAFKISGEGDIIWSSNLDRKITYSGWFVNDLKVINQDNKFYVIYGSSYQTNAKKKNRSSKKSKKQKLDRFEYAVFNYSDGTYKKNEFVVNAINAKEKKTVDPVSIDVIDNKFFVNYEKIGFRPGTTALFCVTAVACWPAALIWYGVADGSLRKGKGNLGVITPLK